MSRSISLTINPELSDFIEKMIQSGRYDSDTAVVQSALRLLEKQENRSAALQSAAEAGERSGESDLSLRDIAADVKNKNGYKL
jgi:antitoxin ParD1/3/4